MPKNIVICSDGTGNSAIKGRGTNVFKLYEAADLHGHELNPDLTRQVAFYDDGVGTERFKPLQLLGGAFGLGLSQNIRRLYADIVRTYEPDDQIYLFGFSRGAYTVRALAGLITTCGLLDRGKFGNDDDLKAGVRRAYREYRRKYRTTLGRYVRKPYTADSAREFRERESAREVSIKFVGVWDSVDAVGLPDDIAAPINALVYRFQFPDLKLSPLVKRACHALSIDDERRTFRPVMWDADGEEPERIEQVWFAGVHANVGGGYPKQGMSLVALDWMMSKAEAAGLRFLTRERDEYRERRNVTDKLYNSRAGLAVYYRYTPRDIATMCEAHHTTPRIHMSALERVVQGAEGYAPGNIPMTGTVVVTDNSGVNLARVSQALRGALTGQTSLLVQVRPWVRFRECAHYLFLVLAISFIVGAVRTAGPADVINQMGSWNGCIELVWALLSTRWGIGLLALPVVFWLLGRWASTRMRRYFSHAWHGLVPGLRKALP